MAAFTVDPDVLNDFASLLSRATDHVRDCESYFNNQVRELSPVDSGLFNLLAYEHGGIRQRLATVLQHLDTLLESSAEGMTAAATQYRESDEGSAARVDASYPEIQRPALSRD